MNLKQNIITWIAFMLALFGLSYWMIAQNKVRASQEIIEAQNRIEELSWMILQAKDAWNIAEWAKQECIESWTEQQTKANKEAELYRAEIKSLEGFIKSRQAQK